MAGIKSEEEMRAGRIAQKQAITDAIAAASRLKQGIKTSPWGKEMARKADAGLFGFGGATPALASETTLAPILPQIDITKGGEAVSPLKGIGLDAQSLADMGKPLSYAGTGITPAATPTVAPSVEAPLPAGGTGPWSREQRNEYLGLNEGKIIKGGGPGGTDLLTNREQPFTQPKELPQEAYGVGGSKEKEAMMADYEKEMRTPFASVEKIKAMERRLGIGKEISPFEEKRLSLEEKKIAQDADQFAKTHDMKIRQNQEQLAMAMGGFTETEVLDPAGTGTIKVRTPNPEFFKEAFDEEGNFDLKNAMKSIENSRVFQSAKAKLSADPKNATVIKERLKAAGYSDAEIKKRLGI